MAKVKRAERALAEARAARAALDAELGPLEQPHRYATYGSVEEMHAGGSFNPGIDTGEAAQAYRERAQGEQGA